MPVETNSEAKISAIRASKWRGFTSCSGLSGGSGILRAAKWRCRRGTIHRRVGDSTLLATPERAK
jgi:hypothetical protein